MTVDEVIRQVLAEEGNLLTDAATVSESADLYDEGLTSHATINVMLALEDTFDFEFPDRLLRKHTFSSIKAIREALMEIQDGAA
jgi:acyl carrier protein